MKYSQRIEELGEDITIDVDDDGTIRNPPYVIVLEPTNRCNLACRHCHHGFLASGGMATGDMSYMLFSRMAPSIGRAKLAAFTGFGEPYLYRGLYDIIRDTKHLGTLTAVTTNGTLLDELSILRTMEAGLDYMELSIDGLEWNRKLRGIHGRNILERASLLSDMKDDMGYATPRLSLAFVAMNSNLEELPKLVEEAASCGIEEVRVQPLQVFLRNMADENIYRKRRRAEKLLENAAEMAEKCGIGFYVRRSTLDLDERFSSPRRYLTSYHRELTCVEPFSRFYVDRSGNTYLCCGGRPSGMNVFNDLPDRIWNSMPYRSLRRSLMAGGDGICRKCNQIFGSEENQFTPVD